MEVELTSEECHVAAKCARAYPPGWGEQFLAIENTKNFDFHLSDDCATWLTGHPEDVVKG
jgi:hypothetical protein